VSVDRSAGAAGAPASKLSTLSAAAALVPDGAHIALGGFAVARNATAFARELIRQGRRGLTVSQGIVGFETDLLVGAGTVTRLIYGGGSLDRFGLVVRVNRAVERREIVAESWSGLAITYKYLAGALGLPFMTIRSLRASDVLARLRETAPDQVGEVTCPFTGEPLLAARALTPGVAVIQVQRADASGNAQILGPRWDNWEAARAAERVIVMTEELVPVEVIRERPELTVIPAHRVAAVVHLPYGAHPTALYPCYDYDAEHLTEYVAAAKDDDGFRRYLDRYLFEPSDHEAYLERVGGSAALERLTAAPGLGYSPLGEGG
jgi:acyl CoA:acetate/3-ketoacid CoA transferase alpha subunit